MERLDWRCKGPFRWRMKSLPSFALRSKEAMTPCVRSASCGTRSILHNRFEPRARKYEKAARKPLPVPAWRQGRYRRYPCRLDVEDERDIGEVR